MKKNYMFILLVGILMIFLLVGCQEKMPTKCPSYIDLSLDRELALLDTVESVEDLRYERDLYPSDACRIYALGDDSSVDGEAIYVTDENVLYLVSYNVREVQGVLYKYVTKMAVRDGDKYIYRTDNWSGNGLVVEEYHDIYQDYFYMCNKEPVKKTAPDYIDSDMESRRKNMKEIIETDFSKLDDPCDAAKKYVPEGATVYSVNTLLENLKEIIYVTSDGICYKEIYSDLDYLRGKFIEVHAMTASDNYVYLAKTYDTVPYSHVNYLNGQLSEIGANTPPTVSAYPKDANDEMVQYIDLWRAERGLTPQPLPMINSNIYIEIN